MAVKNKKFLPRYRRVAGEKPALVLQERDIAIINAVYEYRLLNSELIKTLIDGSERRILSRLQSLFHHGYLDRMKGAVSSPIVYALGNKGANLLSEIHNLPRGKIDWRKKNQEVKEFYMAHTLQVARFRATLTLSLRKKQETELLFWIPEGELKREVFFVDGGSKTRIPIVPDGFFALEDKGDLMFFFVEADRSTMTNRRFFNKMRGYFQFWKALNQQKEELGHSPFQVLGFGIEAFRVLVITKSEERSENLRRITRQADDWRTGFEGFWFACEKNYELEEPQSVLKPIWQTPKDDSFHYLLE